MNESLTTSIEANPPIPQTLDLDQSLPEYCPCTGCYHLAVCAESSCDSTCLSTGWDC